MTSIIPFNFNENAIRVLNHSCSAWFVAKDVTEALGYKRSRDAVARHCKGAVKRRSLTEGGMQELIIIPESDVYRLVFRSKLPQAESFERWVVEEVLPTIRKHGVYSHINPSDITRSQLIRLFVDAETENKVLRSELSINTPKVMAFHQLIDDRGTSCITDAAKQLQVRPGLLFEWLENNKWIFKRLNSKHWIAYQSKLNQGLLVHKLGPVFGRFSEEIGQVRVTKKGLTKLAEIMNTTIAA